MCVSSMPSAVEVDSLRIRTHGSEDAPSVPDIGIDADRTGKDIVAAPLIDLHGFQIEIQVFADGLELEDDALVHASPHPCIQCEGMVGSVKQMVVKYIRHIGFPSSIVFSQWAIMEDDVGRSESVVIRILVSDNGGTDYFGYVSYTSYLQPVVIVIEGGIME